MNRQAFVGGGEEASYGYNSFVWFGSKINRRYVRRMWTCVEGHIAFGSAFDRPAFLHAFPFAQIPDGHERRRLGMGREAQF